MSSTPSTPSNVVQPLTFPTTLIKQIEFKVENEADYAYLQTKNEFEADLKAFCADQSIELISVDGIKVE